MSKTVFVVPSLIALAFPLLFAGCHRCLEPRKAHVGDREFINATDPFNDSETTVRVVVAVSGDYAQYEFRTERGFVGTNSCLRSSFRP